MESTNGLNIRDDYPQRLGDSTKDLIWRQAWLLNMCFLPSPLEHQKNSTESESTGGIVLSLGASGTSLNLLRAGDDKGTKLKYS